MSRQGAAYEGERRTSLPSRTSLASGQEGVLPSLSFSVEKTMQAL